MSFFSNNRTQNCPGPLTHNPTSGLCEKACIEVKKVFDACLKQLQEEDLQVTVTTYSPADPAFPLTFVSANCISGAVTIDNLVVDRFEDKPCFARVSGDVVIPLEINYTDANGVAGVATGTITINQDVVLYVPQPSVFPFAIEALASCVTPTGEYVSDNIFEINVCITIILKVVVEAELLVPSYGYCPIPQCQDYSQDACTGFFNLPLYPQITPVDCQR